MHDAQYRLSIAWQNVGYNQPPHLGFTFPREKKILWQDDFENGLGNWVVEIISWYIH